METSSCGFPFPKNGVTSNQIEENGDKKLENNCERIIIETPLNTQDDTCQHKQSSRKMDWMGKMRQTQNETHTGN